MEFVGENGKQQVALLRCARYLSLKTAALHGMDNMAILMEGIYSWLESRCGFNWWAGDGLS